MSENEKIQIVAFSTNDSENTPNEIIEMYLNLHSHNILKKSKHAVAFSTVLPETISKTKIMICSVLNLSREYDGIKDVNCYMIFVDMKNENSKEKLELIIAYLKENCDINKKFFILGMTNEKSDLISFDKKLICKILDRNKNFQYEFREMNLDNNNEVSNIISDILVYSTKHSINEEKELDKDQGNANSCKIC